MVKKTIYRRKKIYKKKGTFKYVSSYKKFRTRSFNPGLKEIKTALFAST